MFFLSSTLSHAATIYMGSGETYTTLEAAVAAMSGGDTLIIRDGVYSGLANTLDHQHMPPSGTVDTPTIIQAENDGEAVFSDGFFIMEDVGGGVSYVDFVGLKALKPTVISSGTDHWRFMRCAFTNIVTTANGESPFSIAGTYHLIEDSWVWGDIRYGMYVSSVGGQYIIFRRCVIRPDKINATEPTAAFQSYSSPDIYFQNCIVLDGNDQFWLQYDERGPCFYSRTAGPVTISGSMCLNYPSYFAGGSPRNGLYIDNSVGWDIGTGVYADFGDQQPASWSVTSSVFGSVSGFVDPITPGNPDTCPGDGILSKRTTVNGIVENNILYDVDAGKGVAAALTGSTTVNNYICLYNNYDDYNSITGGANNITNTDPLAGSLEYLTRIENSSALKGVGSGGADIGATILCKIGADGARYGDAGWNITRACPLHGDGGTSADNLWPWPYEDRIKTDMASYSYTGVDADGTPDQTLSGARGFAAIGDVTLTSYIWEYLGNQIPGEIYGPVHRGGGQFSGAGSIH